MAHVVRRSFQHRDLRITLAIVETAGRYRVSAFAEGDDPELWPMSWTDHAVYSTTIDALAQGADFARAAADERIGCHVERRRRRLQLQEACPRPAPAAA